MPTADTCMSLPTRKNIGSASSLDARVVICNVPSSIEVMVKTAVRSKLCFLLVFTAEAGYNPLRWQSLQLLGVL